MAFRWTNFDKTDGHLGGYAYDAAGANNKAGDALLALRDAILAGSVRWKEVTGGSPTPAFLQPLASTAVAGDGSLDQQVTLYDSEDPALALGSPYCRVIRFQNTFNVNRNKIEIQVLDTKGGTTFQVVGGSVTNLNGETWRNAWTQIVSSTSGTFNDPTWIYVMESDNVLTTVVRRQSDNVILGFSLTFYTDEVDDGHVTRNEVSHIASAFGEDSALDAWFVSNGGVVGAGNRFELGIEGVNGDWIRQADVLGRSFVHRINLCRDGNSSTPVIWPYLDGVRLINGGNVSGWGTVVTLDIDGTPTDFALWYRYQSSDGAPNLLVQIEDPAA